MSSSFKQKQLLIGSLFATNFILIGSLHAADSHLSLKCGSEQNPNGTINLGASPVGVNKSLLANVNHADGWKLLSDSLTINNDHTYCHFEFSARNSTMPVEGVFFDSAEFKLEIITTGGTTTTTANLLADSNFEPPLSGFEAFFRTPGNVATGWKPEEWNAERAFLENAISSLIPHTGDVMVQACDDGLVVSQISQIIQLPALDPGSTVIAHYSVNTAVPEPGDDSALCSGRTPGNGIPGPGDTGSVQIPMVPLAGLLVLSLGITFGAYKARSKKAK